MNNLFDVGRFAVVKLSPERRKKKNNLFDERTFYILLWGSVWTKLLDDGLGMGLSFMTLIHECSQFCPPFPGRNLFSLTKGSSKMPLTLQGQCQIVTEMI